MESPRYLVAVFGEVKSPNKTRVESGWYPPESGFAPHHRAGVGDFLLTYCGEKYPDGNNRHPYSKSVAGVGVVVSSQQDDGLRYRFLPLENPIGLEKVRGVVTEDENRIFNTLHLSTHWLFEITPESFWGIIQGAALGGQGSR